MKKVLLCPPKYYDIEYEINPWMDVTKKVDHQKAKEEHQELKQVYQELGLEILEIPQEKGLPDMVYAANHGFPKGTMFIKSNYKFDQRKQEAAFAKAYFQKLGFVIKELPEYITWEGQGDLLMVGRQYVLGWGKRSDFAAKKYLSEYLDTKIIDFKLVNPYYYHLDTCFLPLNDKTVAINPVSFEKEGLEKIAHHFPNVIRVEEQDNAILACNATVIDKTIVIGKGISQKLKDDFAQYDYTTREVPMEEFRKGGGSVKCLTLEFY